MWFPCPLVILPLVLWFMCHVLIGCLSHVSCLSLVGSCHVTCIVWYKARLTWSSAAQNDHYMTSSTARAIREQTDTMHSNRSRGTLMSYSDHSVKRCFKSNAPINSPHVAFVLCRVLNLVTYCWWVSVSVHATSSLSSFVWMVGFWISHCLNKSCTWVHHNSPSVDRLLHKYKILKISW